MTNDLDRRFLLGGLAGAAGVSALAAMAKGGPLSPPAGAVSPTSKPLGEIEPRIAVNAVNTPPGGPNLFRITQPGSYYLTGNIQGVAGRNGIEISVGGVTLDLCGFTVAGVAGTGDGILGAGSGASGTTVVNGFVRGWGASGVTFFNGARNARVSGVVSSGNGGAGIYVESYANIADCEAFGNTGAGIAIGQSGLIERCISTGNSTGISVSGEGAIIGNCLVRQNTAQGIVTALHSLVSGCCVLDNGGDGISINARNRVIGNTVSRNGLGPTPAAGIRVVPSSGGYNHIEGNTVSVNGRGYVAESIRNYFVRNMAENNGINWVIPSGNFAMIIQAGGTGAAVSGNAGGAPLSASGYDPSANFTLG